jgi:hypothetical protein
MLKPWLPVLVCAVLAGGLLPLRSASAWYYNGGGGYSSGNYLSGYGGHGNSYGFSATAGYGGGYRYSYSGYGGGGVSNPMGYTGNGRGTLNQNGYARASTQPFSQTWLGKLILDGNNGAVCGNYNRMPESCYRHTTRYVAEMERKD